MIARQSRTSPQMCVCPLTRGPTHGSTSTDTYSKRYLMVGMYCCNASMSVQLPLQRSNTRSLRPRGKSGTSRRSISSTLRMMPRRAERDGGGDGGSGLSREDPSEVPAPPSLAFVPASRAVDSTSADGTPASPSPPVSPVCSTTRGVVRELSDAAVAGASSMSSLMPAFLFFLILYSLFSAFLRRAMKSEARFLIPSRQARAGAFSGGSRSRALAAVERCASDGQGAWWRWILTTLKNRARRLCW